MKKLIALLLSISMVSVLALPVTAAEKVTTIATKTEIVQEDLHDQKIQKGIEALANEKDSATEIESPQDELQDQLIQESNEAKPLQIAPQNVGGLIKLVQVIFTQVGKAIKTTATNRNVVTQITKHAMEEAFKDGITSIILNTILGEVSASGGPFRVEKYDDTTLNSRIFYDYGTKIVVVLSKDDNTIITTYKDTSFNGPSGRISSGRWVLGSWMFK